MTRNTIPSTTTYTSVKCNKVCSTYRIINTFVWGSAQPNRVISTPDSVDYQDEHEFGLFSIAREAAQLSGKLAAVDPGLLGPSGGTGVPNRVYHNPSTITSATRDIYLRGKTISNGGGSKGALGQGRNRGDPSRARKISGREEGWGLPPGGEPKTAEPIRQTQTLQNERPPSLAILDPILGLDGKAGPQGCLSTGPNTSRPPSIPATPMQGHNLSIQVSPLWPISSTTGLYKAAETSSWLPSAEGIMIIYLETAHHINILKLLAVFPALKLLPRSTVSAQSCAKATTFQL